ncbi:SIMPL domain-containing protein [Pseudomonas sp. Marseille-Q0931]|uniref:SIMPL domain-containing protein n=1 Tax=Pseudomonas sp. Marseille-Q0931 TaxID=2697507 RepID=UPI0023B95B1A|nr:SIMPL domain-containing protein [Pseudomonas sp. Marseille-Q0931]
MRTMPRIASILALTIAGLASTGLLADEARYNQIALRAEVNQEVAHDLMHVTLYTEAQNSDPAKLAAEITNTLNKTLEQVRQVRGVSVKLGSRNSYPVYDDKGQNITAWRERAEVRMESADFARLSALTGDLLQSMKMAGMDFSIATDTRKTREDAMLKDAVDAFKARAQLATEALGGKSYKLVNLSISTGGFQPPMAMRNFEAKSMAMMDAAPTPQIEAGTSQVTVSADGVIEVQMP